MKVSDPNIEAEVTINRDVNLIWSAITELEHMRAWFFDNIPEFKAEVGFQTSFMVSTGERSFTHLWRITAVEQYKKITYNWKYQEYDGDSFIHFELYSKGKETVVKVTAEVIEDFPDEIPEFRSESCQGGWNYFIKERLPQYLSSLD